VGAVTTDFNDIGISGQLDWRRIRKLLATGLFASVLHMVGDMILGWGVEDETKTGILRMLSAYTGTSDGGILAAARIDREIAGADTPILEPTARTRQVTVKQPISRQSRNLSRIRARYASPVRVA